MVRQLITFEDFNPSVEESYTDVPYIVEDDPELQPAVALQQILKNYGPAKVFSGYTSDSSDSVPVTSYRPDIFTVTDEARVIQGEQVDKALRQRSKSAKTAPLAKDDASVGEQEPQSVSVSSDDNSSGNND